MVSAKKILFITHVGTPGGAEKKMLALCASTRERAEVLYFQHGQLDAELKALGIKSSFYPLGPSAASFKRKSSLISLVRVIPSLFFVAKHLAKKAQNFHCVVCMSQKSFILASISKPFFRKPIIWYMNDLLSREHFSPYLIFILTFLARFSANHIVLNSEASLDAWKSAGGVASKASISYSGIDVEEVDLALSDVTSIREMKEKYAPDGAPLIGMFGRISEWKGQDVFIKSIYHTPGVRAIIVGGPLFGENEYEIELRRLVSKLELNDRITFIGHSDNVIKLMAACDIVAHCSTASEPFGRVIVEAMMAGIPVVATNAGGVKEIIIDGHTGLLVPKKDFDSLSKAYKKYIQDPEWAKTVVMAARSRAQTKFSSAVMVNQFLNLVDEI